MVSEAISQGDLVGGQLHRGGEIHRRLARHGDGAEPEGRHRAHRGGGARRHARRHRRTHQVRLRRGRREHPAGPAASCRRSAARAGTLMIANAIASLGPWAWIILGVVLIGIELLAPGVFFIWLGLAAIATGLIDARVRPVLAARRARLRRAGRRRGGPGRPQPGAARARSTTRRRPRSTAAARRSSAASSRSRRPIVDGAGRIRVDDSSWRVTGPERPAGARVRVVRVEGTTLVVEDALAAAASGGARRAAGRDNARGRPGGRSRPRSAP